MMPSSSENCPKDANKKSKRRSIYSIKTAVMRLILKRLLITGRPNSAEFQPKNFSVKLTKTKMALSILKNS